MTKAVAKKDRSSKRWENKLDKLVRDQSDGQTSGIPVGPDASLVIAEVVLSAVDEALGLSRERGFRFVDDFEIGCETRSEAEETLNKLRTALAEYELTLNPAKTNISELPMHLLEWSWTATLGQWDFAKTAKAQAFALLGFFDNAFDTAARYRGDQVIKYAVGRLSEITIFKSNWKIVQDLLLQSTIAENQVLLEVIPLLLRYRALGHKLDVDRIQEVLGAHIVRQAPLGNASEVAWAIWTLSALKCKIPAPAAAAVSQMDDSVVALLALNAEHTGLVPSGLCTRGWERHIDAEGLYGEHWMLAYEAHVRGWLSGSLDYVTADPNFGALRKAKVHFFDPALITAPSSWLQQGGPRTARQFSM